jgi:murein DD-endopeptidase MepM/ murein hydrolase activator NlpD
MHRRIAIPPMPRRLTVALLSVVLTLSVVGSGALADTRKELEAAEHRAERMARLIAEEEAAVARVREKMNVLAGKIEVATSELQAAIAETRAARKEVARTRARLEQLLERLDARVADAFMTGLPNAMTYLFFANSVSEMGDRLLFLQSVVDGDVAIADKIEAERAALVKIRTELAEVMERRQELVDQLAANEAELEAALEEQQERIAKLAALRDEAQGEVGELLVKIRQELLARGGDGVLGPLYVCPVAGPTAYGDTFGIIHVHPGWTHRHQGNDMMAQLGTPLVAPFDGYVTNGAQKNAGIYVKVQGEDGYVLMMHLLRLGKLGAVKEGDVVGYVGVTGNASGPHVHFEWHPNNGPAVDPYAQLNEVC